jgi:hypothetical protein
MSQEQATEESQRDLQHKRQHDAFAQMLPFKTLGADIFGSSLFPSNSTSSPVQNSPGHRQLNYSPYSTPGYPFQFPTASISSPTMAMADVNREAVTNSTRPRGELKLPREHRPPPQPRRPLWPNYAPGYPLPLGQMYSRVPSNDVGRKVPRKSIASTPPQDSSPQPSKNNGRYLRKRTNEGEHRQKREPSSEAQQQQGAQDGQRKRLKTAPPAPESTPAGGRQYLNSAYARKNRRVILDEEDGEDKEEEEKEKNSDGESPPEVSIDSDTAVTPTSATRATTRATTKSIQLAKLQSQRPRPRYEYSVPTKLEGIKQALGEEGWNDYLILTERKLLGEVTEDEFEARSKQIFMVLEEQIGQRIEKLVLKMVEQHAEDEASDHAYGLD